MADKSFSSANHHLCNTVHVTKLHIKIGRLDACLTQEKIKITALETLFAEHEKRLDQERKDFREIKADVSTINKNIAVLLDRAKSEQ